MPKSTIEIRLLHRQSRSGKRMKTERAPDSKLAPGRVDWNACPGLWRNPRRMSGAWCFDQGRVTVSSLFQNLRSGLTVTEFLDIFPMKNGRNVGAVLRYIIEQLREEATTGSDSIVSDAQSVDWRDYPGIEINAKRHTNEWVFRGTERSVAELFEHIAEGGSTCAYCKRFPEVRPAEVEGLLNFLVSRLEAM